MKLNSDTFFALLSGVVYFIGFPFAFLTLIMALPCYPSNSGVYAGPISIAIMLLMIIYSYKVFGYKPGWRRSLWTLGFALIFLSCAFDFSLTSFCPATYYAHRSALGEIYALDGVALPIVIVLALAYIIGFGYWAIKTPASANVPKGSADQKKS